ncbi:eukaryotic translation initiation factor related protein [Cyclospora cayetanensis]|uniref:Eukaryotic translation initiation factor related protein n=1 Tax=Cyclospora cayetanensis TaxID=88456 RepID=A0A1D3D4U1_9EIME|nr:eukaryotic translation initiation factor related protein [Cyclospora cayetanensis]
MPLLFVPGATKEASWSPCGRRLAVVTSAGGLLLLEHPTWSVTPQVQLQAAQQLLRAEWLLKQERGESKGSAAAAAAAAAIAGATIAAAPTAAQAAAAALREEVLQLVTAELQQELVSAPLKPEIVPQDQHAQLEDYQQQPVQVDPQAQVKALHWSPLGTYLVANIQPDRHGLIAAEEACLAPPTMEG